MPHSIQQVAEQLLFGKTLQDKLVSFQIQHLLHQTNSETTDVSSRYLNDLNCQVDLQNWLFRKRRGYSFQKNFEDCNARGIAMHFLPTMNCWRSELMALCLLRFPHSPQKFQKGLLSSSKKSKNIYNSILMVPNVWGLHWEHCPSIDSFGMH